MTRLKDAEQPAADKVKFLQKISELVEAKRRCPADDLLSVVANGRVAGPDGTPELNLDWPNLARPGCTVVVYMGLAALPLICERLIAHGLPALTPDDWIGVAEAEKNPLPRQT